MSASFDFDPVERLTTGAVGEPGQRVFYLQAAAEGQLVTLLAEKEQVQALATAIARLLAMLPDVADEGPEITEEEMDLVEPLVPEWRAGSMGLDYDETGDRIVLAVTEAVIEDEEGAEPEPASFRVAMTRAQARAFAIRGDEVCALGRPRCRVCGLPLDPEGHVCPATNGHRSMRV